MNELEQLLKNLKSDAAPSATFRQNARIRILNSVTRPAAPALWHRPRFWGYVTGSAIATVALSVGTVFAAQSSLPDSSLYPVKVLSEHIALTLAPTTQIKNTVAATIISHRIDEMEQSQKSGDAKEFNDSVVNFNQTIDSLEKRNDVSHEHINETLSKHKEFLNSLKHKKDEEDNTPETPQLTPSQETKKEQESESTPTAGPLQITVTPHEDLKLPTVEGESIQRHEDE